MIFNQVLGNINDIKDLKIYRLNFKTKKSVSKDFSKCLKKTNATFHMLSHDEFALMKEDAVVCNVGRGSVIDTYALIEALDNKSIGGALLDVFEEEPLPADSPLWKNPRVMITPHCSGGYHWKSVQDYYTQLVIRNLNHLKNQEPLENLVNRTKGY